MRYLKFTFAMFAMSLAPGFAQQDDDASRGVARVSVISGEVSIQRGDSGDQVAAVLNAPMVTADRMRTGVGARAEVQFDFANMARLGQNTEIRLAEVQAQRYQVNVAYGLVTFRVWQNSDAEVDLNTPVASVRPMRRGEYRMQVLEDGTTEITVRDGEVDIYTPQGSRRLGSGRTLVIRRASNGEASFETVSQIPLDSWDQWNRSRDNELNASRSRQYLPQGVYGGEQLDAYGDWTYSAPYGYVWSPRVAAGWAPYRAGRWAWLDWYGWSWVSYDPWGWAPYHYGRWFYAGNRWCWWPGAVGVRQFWSPALVSFVGFGRGGLSIGFGFGNVGWVPLAPFETYNRWWGRGYYGGRNVNNITVVNNVNITNIYRNARVDGGVTYVEAQNFNRGGSYQAARSAELQNAGEFRGPVGINPSRESVRYAANDTGVRGGGSSMGFSNREDSQFAMRRQVAGVERVPFEQQMGRGGGVSTPSNGDGWRRVGERGADGYVQRGGANMDGVRGGGATSADGFVRSGGGVRGGDNAAPNVGQQGVRGGGMTQDGFVSRGGGVRGGESATPNVGQQGVRGGGMSQDGFVGRSGGVRGGDASAPNMSMPGVRGGSQDGFVTRGNEGGSSRSGWQRFGDVNVNPSGVRGGGSSDGYVQRDGGVRGGGRGGEIESFTPNSGSRGVGAPVDVSPRIIQRGGESQNQGSTDSFGGVRGGGGRSSDSGWGSFGGVRGSAPQMSVPSYGGGGRGSAPEMSAPSYGGGSRGSAPQMSAPSYGGFGGGGRGSAPQMSAPSGGGGGVRGGGGGGGGSAAPSSNQGGGGGGRGGRGRGQ